MAKQSPQKRRDDTVAQIIAAGGTILSVAALAKLADTSTIAAYRITAGAPTRAVLPAVQTVKAATESDLTGLVAWVDPDLVVPDAS